MALAMFPPAKPCLNPLRLAVRRDGRSIVTALALPMIHEACRVAVRAGNPCLPTQGLGEAACALCGIWRKGT